MTVRVCRGVLLEASPWSDAHSTQVCDPALRPLPEVSHLFPAARGTHAPALVTGCARSRVRARVSLRARRAPPERQPGGGSLARSLSQQGARCVWGRSDPEPRPPTRAHLSGRAGYTC